jgi:hypothetical protein
MYIGLPALRAPGASVPDGRTIRQDRVDPSQTSAPASSYRHFPTDEAAIKLLYLVLRDVIAEWKMPPREWCEAKTQFAIMFDGRFVTA